mmetsp:Transcript_42038/g.107028  ORF Transcript_42038/g.107028 Transcript_42038/m.107028 type:complete len:208 (-) Transcript_42038:199-822(-)
MNSRPQPFSPHVLHLLILATSRLAATLPRAAVVPAVATVPSELAVEMPRLMVMSPVGAAMIAAGELAARQRQRGPRSARTPLHCQLLWRSGHPPMLPAGSLRFSAFRLSLESSSKKRKSVALCFWGCQRRTWSSWESRLSAAGGNFSWASKHSEQKPVWLPKRMLGRPSAISAAAVAAAAATAAVAVAVAVAPMHSLVWGTCSPRPP